MANNIQCVYNPNPQNPLHCYEISWERVFKDTNTNTRWDVNEFPIRISRLTTKQRTQAFCEKHGIPFPISNQELQAVGR